MIKFISSNANLMRRYYQEEALLRNPGTIEKAIKFIAMVEKFPIRLPTLLHLEKTS